MTIIIDNINKIVTLTFKDGSVQTMLLSEWAFAIASPKVA